MWTAGVAGLLSCALPVAFFPVLSNATLGLDSADHNLRDRFRNCGATRWQRPGHLQRPSTPPDFLGGRRVAGGLFGIGAVVAEYVAGTRGIGAGLAVRILEAGSRPDSPRMFAAPIPIAATGGVVFAGHSFFSHMLLHRWHESAMKREH